MKSPPRARSPTVLRILLHSGFGAENGLKSRSGTAGVTRMLNDLMDTVFFNHFKRAYGWFGGRCHADFLACGFHASPFLSNTAQ